MKRRLLILIVAVACTAAILLFLPRIPQSEAYHDFADKRALFEIPNSLNVVSNLFFLIVGVWGLRTIWHDAKFLTRPERWPYAAFFVGVMLTSVGSSLYHLSPNDATLVWDRIPMTIGLWRWSRPSRASESATR